MRQTTSSTDQSSRDTIQNIPPQKRSVLVIDDSVDVLLLQRMMLENEGFEVFTAASGLEALDMLDQINEPSLILLDMLMGDMSGAEFLTILEEKKPNIVKAVPIVFLTGMDEVPKSKAVGFIRKPTNMTSFLKDVNRYVENGRHAS